MNTQDIKPGYKQTSLGQIPINWEIEKLGNLGKISAGNGFPENYQGNSIGDYPFYKVSDTNSKGNNKYMGIANNYVNEDVVKSLGLKVYKKGTIIFPKVGAVLLSNKRRILTRDSIVDNNLGTFQPTQGNTEFLYYNFLNIDFGKFCGEGAVPSINGTTIGRIEIPLPPLSEQQKITDILLKMDKTIDLTDKMVENLELRNKGLLEKLLSGKKRLNGFNDEWLSFRFKDIYTQTQEKAGDKNYEVLSVTKDGIVSQLDYFNKDISSDDMSGYLVVKKGDFVMSGLNFWMGSAHVLDDFEIGVVSPAYKTYRICNNSILSEFMKYFVESSIMKHALIGSSVQGASIVRRNFDKEMFENRQFNIPPLSEQKAITSILGYTEIQLKLYKQKLEKFKELKKGLMQQLLTGKVRVEEFRN